MKLQKHRKATLQLQDGSVFEGKSFGYEAPVSGELVFNTAMTGYPESLTDPSYSGQIIVLTYPSIGNYGVPAKTKEQGLLRFFESEQIHASGLIISDYAEQFNHWNAAQSLGSWLKEEKIPGLYGIDTRMLTKKIRENGSMLAKIVFDDDISFYDPANENLVAKVSCNEKIIYGNGQHKILLVDCGVKSNIIRYLLKFDATIVRVPWNYNWENEYFDGLFISNGPGDPMHCKPTINQLKHSIEDEKPIFGICLGHQLLSLAAGAETYKLKFGHRSHNQPVLEYGTNKAWLTSQNHGYAVENDSIPAGWLPYFVNLNDNSNEGLIHQNNPFFSTQFHPEASSGPTDTAFLFNHFIQAISKWKK